MFSLFNYPEPRPLGPPKIWNQEGNQFMRVSFENRIYKSLIRKNISLIQDVASIISIM